ncbi:MAG: YjbH domain-containing protein, partial [Bacteroidota bacterium]
LIYVSTSNAQDTHFSQYTSSGMLGQTGLVLVPTAQLSTDRAIAVGWSYIPLPSTVRDISTNIGEPEFARSARINFLPFVELSIRFTKTKEINELGDRSIFARIQLLRETDKRPAFAIGAHDIVGQVPHYHSFYAVTTKHFNMNNGMIVGGHLGYGLKTRDNARNEQLLGLFGATTLRYRFVEAGLEYDGANTNAALKLFWKNRISVSANLLGLKHIGCSAHAYFVL